MKTTITFDINPTGKGRPRVTRTHTYTPKKTKDAEYAIQLMARSQFKREPLRCPLRVDWEFVFEHPKSWSKKCKAETYWHTSKPDFDNIMKLVGDALNGIVWHDDSQICTGGYSKHYGEKACVKITIDTDI
tara:strand:+ start:247 stop:639 length:393 start_codon:yes stop_codon:yes gene_type:complete